ncbi:hypothetical protein [Streptantibioticus ferralitis]|uniref:hypothetical protein n=1 Tax=Streptantibioticus ferralitis TaxID=236510 RepID=UPI0027E293D0|nr:hypothetical protein [Streptantibioticus ferralitis]
MGPGQWVYDGWAMVLRHLQRLRNAPSLIVLTLRFRGLPMSRSAVPLGQALS